MGRRARPKNDLDTELTDLPPALRWREWMGRVEAVIFASPAPVTREMLARVVGRDCSIDLLIDDIRDELRGRPYELVSVAGGWQHRTRKNFAEAIRIAIGAAGDGKALSQNEALILACIAYYQPINRSELSSFFGKEVSRDTIARLRGLEFIAAGPRSPQPGAPYTYVTTKAFLSHFGLETLRDLPDMEMLEEAGLLSKDKMLAGEFPMAADLAGGDGETFAPESAESESPEDDDPRSGISTGP
ncbi:segregation and condensation protein B [Bradyrhizobium diazoefficiens]